jgi:hypothetical protein
MRATYRPQGVEHKEEFLFVYQGLRAELPEIEHQLLAEVTARALGLAYEYSGGEVYVEVGELLEVTPQGFSGLCLVAW